MKKNNIKESLGKPYDAAGPNSFHIWVDGSHRPPDNASCAYLIFSKKTSHIVDLQRYACRGRTINQMELEAINKALDFPKMDDVVIYSDSMYSISCLTLWRHTWKRNNWISPLGEPIKNRELIESISAKIDSKKSVKFVKIKAHTGNPFNSLVDYLVQDLSLKMRDDPTSISSALCDTQSL